MKKVLFTLGVLMLAQLMFVGLVHVLINVQGKNSPETLESLHAMPVIGGYFFPPSVDREELTADQVRDLKAVRNLRESLQLYELPAGFSREEMEKLSHDLASARTANDQLRIALDAQHEALAAERREEATERKRLETLATELTPQAESLQAGLEELSHRENRLAQAETKNLRTVRATYEKMQPAKEADILGGMEIDLVARILAGMSDRTSARILQEFEAAPEGGGTSKAVQITKRMMAITSGAADKNKGGSRAGG